MNPQNNPPPRNYAAMSTPDLIAWFAYHEDAADRWAEHLLELLATNPDNSAVALLQEKHHRDEAAVVWKLIEWRTNAKALPPGGAVGWSRAWIAQVKSSVSLADLVRQDGVELTDNSYRKEQVGVCPFHADTNGSLHVNSEKGLWHCYGIGCQQGGDAITWLMQKRNLSFRDAVTTLAQLAHLELPDDGAVSPERVLKILRRHVKTGE